MMIVPDSMRLKTLLILALAVAVSWPAHSKDAAGHPLLLDARYLKENHPLEHTVFIDVRSEVEYGEGHISGAVNIPITRLFSRETRPDLVVSINEARSIFGNAGIDMSTPVALYDSGNFIDAARAFWVLELYGHEKVSLIDGGYPALLNLDFPVTTEVDKIEPKQFIPTVVPERLSTMLSVRLAIDDSETVLLDARSEEEYSGKKSHSQRKGHIPNAINIPATRNFGVIGEYARLRSDTELNALYSPIEDNKRIITYCNKGKESALTYFVLRKLGRNVSAYDGSWYEWGNDLQLPIAESQ
jgi:thiosulfate/3-mercaptopyruvate sulfurtransferase